MSFWDNFLSLCNQNSTSPNAVCSKLNFSTATATHWKNGSIPKGDALIKIANYFNVSVDYLLGRVDKPNITLLEKEERQLLDNFSSLSPEDKELVLKTFDYFTSGKYSSNYPYYQYGYGFFSPNVQLAETIKNLCSKKHISISQMLSECNMSYSFIQLLEHSVSPSIEDLEKIASYFDISIDDILANTHTYDAKHHEISKLSDTSYLSTLGTSITINEILSNVLKLNKSGKTKVLDYINDLSENTLYKANNSPDIADSVSSAKIQSEVHIAANENECNKNKKMKEGITNANLGFNFNRNKRNTSKY